MRKIVSFYGKIVSFVTILLLVFAGTFMIPRLWGWEPLIVMSGSMEPTIPTGSVLFVDTNSKNAEPGEIITYRLETNADNHDRMVTHRMVRTENDQYITKGDSNNQEDFVPVKAEQIVGTYLFHIPKAGWIISRLDRKLLITAAVWLLLLNVFGVVWNSMVDVE